MHVAPIDRDDGAHAPRARSGPVQARLRRAGPGRAGPVLAARSAARDLDRQRSRQLIVIIPARNGERLGKEFFPDRRKDSAEGERKVL